MIKVNSKNILLLLVLFSLFSFSSLAYGASSEVPAPPAEYQDKVIFHTPTHLAKYNSANLGGINPHVLFAFILLMVILVPLVFWYRRKINNQKPNLEPESKNGESTTGKDKIKKHLIEQKIKSLELQFAKGEVSQTEYQTTLNKYQDILSDLENRGKNHDRNS